MGSAKALAVKPIDRKAADALVRRVHYSGKVVPNSQLHLGVFLDDRLEGVMQFGPSMDKRKSQALVAGTGWNGFIELNRMAFSDRLPRNSESRAIAVAMRLIRKHYPHIEWVLSFSDGTQCGDGTIYRASGFVLTGIKRNGQILELADGSRVAKKSLDNENYPKIGGMYYSRHLLETGQAKPLEGFQLRYVYFLNQDARKRLTVPEIPFSRIDELGAGMYKGQRIPRSSRAKDQAADDQSALGGETPTRTLQHSGAYHD